MTGHPNPPKWYTDGFDPTAQDAPGAGDGLPIFKHTIYDSIEACADDHHAGVLFYKMAFYCRRAKMLIDGKRWYVRARESLCLETRLTRHQYDRALRFLKDFNFVETRRVPLSQVHVFGPHTAFRVTKHGNQQLRNAINLRGPVKSGKK
jgi:hypothetical protein